MTKSTAGSDKDLDSLCTGGQSLGNHCVKMRFRMKRTTLLLAGLVILTIYIKLSKTNILGEERRDAGAGSATQGSISSGPREPKPGDPDYVPDTTNEMDEGKAEVKHVRLNKFEDRYLVDIGGVTFEKLDAEHKVAPFEAGQAHKVLIISYRGAEGTLIGQLVDNTPDSMHVTEPLDGVYTAMYGSRDYLVPEDIMNNKDGSLRILPTGERDAVANVVGDILDCKIEGIPTDTLTHPYWFRKMGSQMSNLPLIECLKASELVFHRQCRPLMMKDCPGRFDPSLPKTPKCKEFLWDVLGGNRGGEYIGEPDATVTVTVRNYTECMKDARKKIERCERIMHTYCSNTKIRGVTVVRAPMDVAVPIMEKDPNFRVIHIVRNPQAIAAIRSKYDNASKSFYGEGDPVREASMYCQQVKHDREVREELEKRFPGRTLEVPYEEYIDNPSAWTEMIFKFLDTELVMDVREYVVSYAPLFQKDVKNWFVDAPYNVARFIRDTCNIMWYGKAYDI